MMLYDGKYIEDELNDKPSIYKFVQSLGIKPIVISKNQNFSILSSKDSSEYNMIIDGSNLVGIFQGKLDEFDYQQLFDKYLNGELGYPLKGYSLKNIQDAYNTISIEDCYSTGDEGIIAVCSYFELIYKLTNVFLYQIGIGNKEIPNDYYTFIKKSISLITQSIENSILLDEEITIDRLIADLYLGEEAYENILSIANGFYKEMELSCPVLDDVAKKLK